MMRWLNAPMGRWQNQLIPTSGLLISFVHLWKHVNEIALLFNRFLYTFCLCHGYLKQSLNKTKHDIDNINQFYRKHMWGIKLQYIFIQQMKSIKWKDTSGQWKLSLIYLFAIIASHLKLFGCQSLKIKPSSNTIYKMVELQVDLQFPI